MFPVEVLYEPPEIEGDTESLMRQDPRHRLRAS